MRKTITFLTIFTLFILGGCASIQTSNVCQSVPEGQVSAICTLSDKMGTTPENISKVVQISIGLGIETGDIRVKQAKEYLDKIKAKATEAMDSDYTITFEEVLNYAMDEYNKLPTTTRLLITVINPVDLSKYGIKIPCIPYDFEMILMGIEEQYKVVNIYL